METPPGPTHTPASVKPLFSSSMARIRQLCKNLVHDHPHSPSKFCSKNQATTPQSRSHWFPASVRGCTLTHSSRNVFEFDHAPKLCCHSRWIWRGRRNTKGSTSTVRTTVQKDHTHSSTCRKIYCPANTSRGILKFPCVRCLKVGRERSLKSLLLSPKPWQQQQWFQSAHPVGSVAHHGDEKHLMPMDIWACCESCMHCSCYSDFFLPSNLTRYLVTTWNMQPYKVGHQSYHYVESSSHLQEPRRVALQSCVCQLLMDSVDAPHAMQASRYIWHGRRWWKQCLQIAGSSCDRSAGQRH